jgi:hypothetical protein
MHVLEDERPLEQYPPAEGRTNTGEWVRFTMRRIEALRARNDPAYKPRPMNRLRTEEVARRQRAADKAREEAEAAEEEAREAAREARRAAKEAARQAKLKREAEEAEAGGGAVGPVSPSGGRDGKAKATGGVKKEPGTGGGSGAGRDGRNGDHQPAAKKVKLEGDTAGKAGSKQQPGAGGGSTVKKTGSGKLGTAASPSGGNGGSRKRAGSAVNGAAPGGGDKMGRTGSGGGLQSQSSQQLLTLLQTAGRPQARAQEAAPRVKAEPGNATSGGGPRAPSVVKEEASGSKAAHSNGVQVVVKFQHPISAPGPAPGPICGDGGGGTSGGSACNSHGNGNGTSFSQHAPHGVEQVVMLKKRSTDELGHVVGLSAPVSSVSVGGCGGGMAEAKLISLKRESSVDGCSVPGMGVQLVAAGGAYKRTSAEQALPSTARLMMHEHRLQLHELQTLQQEQQQLMAQLQQLQAQRRQADERFLQMQREALPPAATAHASQQHPQQQHHHQHDGNGYHGHQPSHHHHSRVFDMHLNETTHHHSHHGPPSHHQPHPAAATTTAASGLPRNNLLSLHMQEHQQQQQQPLQADRLGSGSRLLDSLRVLSGTSGTSGGAAQTQPSPLRSPLRSPLAASGGCGGLLGGGLGAAHEEPPLQLPRRGSSSTSQGPGLGSFLSGPLGSDGIGSAAALAGGCTGGGGSGGGDHLDLLLQRRRLQVQQRLQHTQQQDHDLLGLGGGGLDGGTDVAMYSREEHQPAPLLTQQHPQYPQQYPQQQQQQQLRLAGVGSPRGVGAGLGAGLLSGGAVHRVQGGIAAEALRLPFPA